MNGFFVEAYREYVEQLGRTLIQEDTDARVEQLRKSVLGDEYRPPNKFLGLAGQVSMPVVVRPANG